MVSARLSGGGSDLVGEKLAEAHVGTVLSRCLCGLDRRPCFAMVAPASSTALHYRLYLQFETAPPDDETLFHLAASVDGGLGENPYYAHARAIGQLGSLTICVLPSVPPTAWSQVERRALAEGQRLGDLKPRALDPRADWDHIFSVVDWRAP